MSEKIGTFLTTKESSIVYEDLNTLENRPENEVASANVRHCISSRLSWRLTGGRARDAIRPRSTGGAAIQAARQVACEERPAFCSPWNVPGENYFRYTGEIMRS